MGKSDHPILVDGHGRQFVQVPVEEFVAMEVAAERAIGAEACLLAKFPGDECRTFAEPPSEWCANCRQRAIGAEALDVERLALVIKTLVYDEEHGWPKSTVGFDAFMDAIAAEYERLRRDAARLTRERNGQ